MFFIEGRIVILGSFNFYKNAEKSNDENLLIIDDKKLAGKFTEEFARSCQKDQKAAEDQPLSQADPQKDTKLILCPCGKRP